MLYAAISKSHLERLTVLFALEKIDRRNRGNLPFPPALLDRTLDHSPLWRLALAFQQPIEVQRPLSVVPLGVDEINRRRDLACTHHLFDLTAKFGVPGHRFI